MYGQLKCQISVKSADADNSYNSFCEVASKREVSSIRQPHSLFNPDSVHGMACWEILR